MEKNREELLKKNLHRNYTPLERQIVARLDGAWRFQPDPQNVGEAEGWHRPGSIQERTIPVPTSWQVVFEDLRSYCGAAWYETVFTVPENLEGHRIVAAFMGIDWYAKIWLNGQLIGEHENGFTAISLDLSSAIQYGTRNTMTIRVADYEDRSILPYDSEMAFLRMTGIWRQAWIEETGQSYVSDIFVIPDIDAEVATVRTTVVRSVSQYDASLQLEVTLVAPDGKKFHHTESCPLAKDRQTLTVQIESRIAVKDPLLWDPDHPQLYKAAVAIKDGDRAIDQAATDFGMRKIDIQGISIRLNNQPIYLRGGLDYVDYPDRNLYLPEYHPWTDEEIQAEIKRWKDLGFNFIRKYAVEDYRYFYWADRLGMLLMESGPVYGAVPSLRWTEELMGRYRDVLEGLIYRDRNHPSLILWTLFNEGGGFGGRREVIQEYYDFTKSLDPTRPIIDNSGGIVHINTHNVIGNHPVTDIDDLHHYHGNGPEYHPDDRDYIASLMARDKPLLITEFLAMVFPPNIDRLRRQHGGKDPWWLYLPYVEGDAPLDGIWPRSRKVTLLDFEDRFYAWGLDKVFGNLEKFVEAVEWRNFHVIKYVFEQIRKNTNLAGYVYTQMNQQPGQGPVGILGDFGFGEPRVFHGELPMVNSADVVFLDWQQINYWEGEIFRAPAFISHFSDQTIKDAILRWSLVGQDLQGELLGVTVSRAEVKNIGEITFRVPNLSAEVRTKIELSLEQDGRCLARNYLYVNLFPQAYARTTSPQTLLVHIPQLKFSKQAHHLHTIAARLMVSGYTLVGNLKNDVPLVITTQIDDQVDAYLAGGGTVLFAAMEPSHTTSDLGPILGDSMEWPHWNIAVDPAFGLFTRIPYENPWEWAFNKVYSRNSIVGLTPAHRSDLIALCWEGRISADLGVGNRTYPQEMGASIAQFKYKNGRIVVTTLRVLEPFLEDPVATIMLHDLIRYCSGPFAPKNEAPLIHEGNNDES